MATVVRRSPGRVLLDSAVPRLLSERPAVVLERPDDGGPARWYRCEDLGRLAVLGPRLLPGSLVSFYFDQRIARRAWTPLLRAEVLARADLAERAGTGFVIGCEDTDGLSLRMAHVRGPGDVDACVLALGAPAALHLGPVPGPDDDGVDAVTVALEGARFRAAGWRRPSA